ncbi:hypothetical protein PILCRDRAFT_15144 [Piloderma croceum F 1598]|uniref:Uncharacterized protein n=1 Tax=Piloderma croceum (strain F 1598) TaxID=765440 RepID=A0A0C3ELV8_PILCF|nr:hypothetical protein PILCRDRAFT_15144 [Piloderma croceum F 1598]
MHFNLSLVTLLLYALNAQPVASAAVGARDDTSLLKRIGNPVFPNYRKITWEETADSETETQ